MISRHFQYIGRAKGDYSAIDNLINNYQNLTKKKILINNAEDDINDGSEIQKQINERISLYKSWGYNEYNTCYYQIFDHQYKEIFKPFINMTGLDMAVSSFITQTPGNTLPFHQDTFINFKVTNKLPISSEVKRYMIFMEDWKPGHSFIVEDEPINDWKKGDMVCWGNKYHSGSNGGSVPKTTLNITGISTLESLHRLENPKLDF